VFVFCDLICDGVNQFMIYSFFVIRFVMWMDGWIYILFIVYDSMCDVRFVHCICSMCDLFICLLLASAAPAQGW
jgi:hypothetical protein